MSEMVQNDRGSEVLADLSAPIAVERLDVADTTDRGARCPSSIYGIGPNGLLGSLSRPVSGLKDTKCTTQAI